MGHAVLEILSLPYILFRNFEDLAIPYTDVCTPSRCHRLCQTSLSRGWRWLPFLTTSTISLHRLCFLYETKSSFAEIRMNTIYLKRPL